MSNKGFPPKFLFFICSLIFARSVVSQSIGEFPSKDPPQLVASGERDKSGRELLTWDKPDAFGKVPEDKRILGNATCLIAGVDLEAIGYHPQAKDRSGREMPGGGFYCAVKADGDRPAATPPRLVAINGIWGWDNPSAFGAVPPELKAKGDAICHRAASHLEAIAYHPQARGTQSEPIFGGGFFCGPRRDGSLKPQKQDSDPASRITERVDPAPVPSIPSTANVPSAKSESSIPPSSLFAKPASNIVIETSEQRPSAKLDSSIAQSPVEIKSIPPGFFVQHKSSPKREEVEQFWSNNPSIREARLVKLTRIGAEGPNFVLLSGPFLTMKDAWNFAKNPSLPKDMWVREASKIRPLLPNER